MKSKRSSRGFTLVEALVVAALIGILALAAVPLLSSQNPTKLDVAAAEVGNALRFAIGEVERIGSNSCAWVDGSVSGHLRVYSNAACIGKQSDWGAMSDPLTKRALDVDTAGPAFSGQIGMAVRFMQGGTAYTRLLITGPGIVVPGPGTLYVYGDWDPATSTFTYMGPLQAGSGVVLTLGPQNVAVAINEIGLVTLP